MRSDDQLLGDILEATRSLEEYVEGIAKEHFLSNSQMRNASLAQLIIIGEAASKLSSELRNKHPEISWSDIVSNRNFVVHEYFHIEWTIIWNTVTKYAIPLQEHIFKILESDFPGW